MEESKERNDKDVSIKIKLHSCLKIIAKINDKSKD